MLSTTQRETFAAQGYLAGLQFCSAADMADLRARFQQLLGDPPHDDAATLHRHLDRPEVHALCAHPAIVECVSSLLGPDLLVWHSRLFTKPPGEPPVPWHQDAPFWNLQPMECLSAWLAFDDTGPHNGCVEVIPGSHLRDRPHEDSAGTGRFGIRTQVTAEEEARAVPVALRAGEFFLFDRWLLHRSGVNLSASSRYALSIRFVAPSVRVDASRFAAHRPPYGVQLVRGEDRFGYNPVAPVPTIPPG